MIFRILLFFLFLSFFLFLLVEIRERNYWNWDKNFFFLITSFKFYKRNMIEILLKKIN